MGTARALCRLAGVLLLLHGERWVCESIPGSPPKMCLSAAGWWAPWSFAVGRSWSPGVMRLMVRQACLDQQPRLWFIRHQFPPPPYVEDLAVRAALKAVLLPCPLPTAGAAAQSAVYTGLKWIKLVGRDGCRESGTSQAESHRAAGPVQCRACLVLSSSPC